MYASQMEWGKTIFHQITEGTELPCVSTFCESLCLVVCPEILFFLSNVKYLPWRNYVWETHDLPQISSEECLGLHDVATQSL